MKIVKNIKETREYLSTCNKSSTLFLFDIDNTIITTGSAFIQIIDKIKDLKTKFNDEELKEWYELLSDWRLQREVFLTDSEWPILLNELRHHNCYALTKTDVGKIGRIESMEEWRYNELKLMQIEFNNIFPISHEASTLPIPLNIDNSTFFKGIFFVGDASKGSIVEKLIKTHQYDHVFFIDDKIEQLEDVRNTCDKLNIQSTLLQFQIDSVKIAKDFSEYELAILNFLTQYESD